MNDGNTDGCWIKDRSFRGAVFCIKILVGMNLRTKKPLGIIPQGFFSSSGIYYSMLDDDTASSEDQQNLLAAITKN